MKTKDHFREKIKESVEAEIYPEQKVIEIKTLAALAGVINSDQADLKYDLLEMNAENFHFRDHRAVFTAMKTMSDAGVNVDQSTLTTTMGNGENPWPATIEAVFDPANSIDSDAAKAYKKTILFWSSKNEALKIGQAFTSAVEQASTQDGLTGLVADIQKAVFDIGKTDRISPPLKTEAESLDDFSLELSNPKPGYETGFKKLDKVIRKLKPGLFVIAAPPSAGKTTFVKQLSDNVAELNEVPVLFFSFEQSVAELRIKTLARLTKIAGKPVDNESIKEGTPEEYTNGKKSVEDAFKHYKRFGKWITIIEGDRRHNVGHIRLLAQREKMKTGKAPLIVIDYLQIIPVSDEALRDKRAEVDFLVSDLRRIARDIEAPVIVISSMSRAEYKDAKMTGFKESGGIEYAADIAAVLAVEEEDGEGTGRTVALNILKNRNGRRGKIGMSYDMKQDYFEETDFNHISYMDALGKEEKA